MSYPTTLTQAQDRNSVAGTCNTNDTAVTRVTGDSFVSIVCGFIEIGGSVDQPGTLYEISSITDADHLVLTSSAGVQSEVYFTAALEIKAIHLNALEAKVGVDDSTVVTSLDYLLKNAASVDPGHKHTPVSGTVANVVTVQTREQGLFDAPISGDGTIVTPLNLVITPKKAGNKIILEWIVNGEMNKDTVYIVTRNGIRLADTTDASNNR